MQRQVEDAMSAGAIGFATSKSTLHIGAGGRPVPSRHAEPAEIVALAAPLRAARTGIIQVTPGPGFFVDELGKLSETTGRPVTWTALLTGMFERGRAIALLDRNSKVGGNVWPQIACRPVVMQITLEDPYLLATTTAFKEILAVPRESRVDLYRDSAWRDRARGEMNRDSAMQRWWPRTSIAETRIHTSDIGIPLTELAQIRQKDPLDLLIDLALEEDLTTRYLVVLGNDDEVELAELLADPRCLLGLSDAGAHTSQLCDACYSTHLLSYWTRERRVLSLEQAIWRLTGHPAAVFGFDDRGRIAPGYVADLTIFDQATVGAEPLERVWDLPDGSDRLISRSRGIRDVFVGGSAVWSGGQEVHRSWPGRLIKSDSNR